MDVVFTYLNAQNEAWAAQYAVATGQPITTWCSDHGEIVFAIQLLLLYCASWLRKIHIVHAGSGLTESTVAILETLLPAARLHLVPQDEIVPFTTFSSCVVEAHLHFIPGLSSVFMYCNDDMFIGQSLFWSDLFHPDGKPYIDMNVYTCSETRNLAQEHCANARAIFKKQFKTVNTPETLWVSHFGSLLTVAGCQQVWHLFRKYLTQPPVLRTNKTINFQLLAGLVIAQLQWGHIRVRTHKNTKYNRIMIEMQPDGIAAILKERPYYFCINGVTDATVAQFQFFCGKYVMLTQVKCPPTFLTGCKK